jgi:hypothetical protein
MVTIVTFWWEHGITRAIARAKQKGRTGDGVESVQNLFDGGAKGIIIILSDAQTERGKFFAVSCSFPVTFVC